MSGAALTDDVQASTEAWRAHVLIEAGYPAADALLLAVDLSVDLHVAVFLAESGCPLETALAILL